MNYTYYSTSNEFLEDENTLRFNIDRLLPGEYSYFIFTRDYANNTNIFYEENFRFTISKHIIEYIFPVALIAIAGVAGLSTLSIYRSIQKYSRTMEKIE